MHKRPESVRGATPLLGTIGGSTRCCGGPAAGSACCSSVPSRLPPSDCLVLRAAVLILAPCAALLAAWWRLASVWLCTAWAPPSRCVSVEASAPRPHAPVPPPAPAAAVTSAAAAQPHPHPPLQRAAMQPRHRSRRRRMLEVEQPQLVVVELWHAPEPQQPQAPLAAAAAATELQQQLLEEMQQHGGNISAVSSFEAASGSLCRDGGSGGDAANSAEVQPFCLHPVALPAPTADGDSPAGGGARHSVRLLLPPALAATLQEDGHSLRVVVLAASGEACVGLEQKQGALLLDCCYRWSDVAAASEGAHQGWQQPYVCLPLCLPAGSKGGRRRPPEVQLLLVHVLLEQAQPSATGAQDTTQPLPLLCVRLPLLVLPASACSELQDLFECMADAKGGDSEQAYTRSFAPLARDLALVLGLAPPPPLASRAATARQECQRKLVTSEVTAFLSQQPGLGAVLELVEQQQASSAEGDSSATHLCCTAP